MPFRIVRNDITKMSTEAIVNTANTEAVVGSGCDSAVYKAAGYEELLRFRTEKIGIVEEGEAFLTPGFRLPAKYIIHTVSPLFRDGGHGEEEKLRACYRNSLRIAEENGIRSIAFPLISTGRYGYPKEEGIRIAADEINAFLLRHEMEVYLVVFDEKAAQLGQKLYPDLEAYIDRNYVREAAKKEYGEQAAAFDIDRCAALSTPFLQPSGPDDQLKSRNPTVLGTPTEKVADDGSYADFLEFHEDKLKARMQHLSDTYSQYLLYLIREKNMKNADVYKRAIVEKKTFSKIKNNPDYHPNKRTALCLCVGAMLNMDETKDLLARAGYALSPCDKTDIIFSYFIENEIYDMIELDIQLENHGEPCVL